MEQALKALRQLSAGLSEAAVWKAAALVPRGDDIEGEEFSELYTWGRGNNYQLGYGVSGNEQQIPKLVQLPVKQHVTSLSCGRFHSTAVTSCGRVFTWGVAGATGRLGIEVSKPCREAVVVEPTQLPQFGPGRHHAVKVATGKDHTLALSSAGKLLVWGSNERGQLGQGGENLLTPVVLKAAALKRVSDIAAGSAHSLCISDGHVFAWGCNAYGALGLGAPPTGPSWSTQPQGLPHVKAAHFFAACGHVSLCLVAAHGDAMIFGGSPEKLEPRFFTPSRVRRQGQQVEDPEWQVQRSAPRPLHWAMLSDAEGFALDTEGLWTWSTSARPAAARQLWAQLRRPVARNEFVLVDEESEQVLEEPELLPPLLPPGVKDIEESHIADLGVSFKAGITWAVDDSAGHLWQLKRAKSNDWAAERYEYLAQVSCFACGPEHQAAVTTYRLPERHPAAKVEDEAEDEEKEPSEVKSKVPSLQEICEEKLCASLSPRSFGLVCDIAWELNRPQLLDRAFNFLCANAPLMFSKLHLPTLSQLPMEVLASFEVAARAKQAAEPFRPEVRAPETSEVNAKEDDLLLEVSQLLASGDWSLLSSRTLALLATSMPQTAAGEGPTAEQLGLAFELPEVVVKETRRKRRTQSSPKAAAKASPAMSSKSSPLASSSKSPLEVPKSMSPVPGDWMEVKRRKSETKTTPQVKVVDPPVPPSPQPKGRGKTLASLDEVGASRHLRLADFMPSESLKGKGRGKSETKSDEKLERCRPEAPTEKKETPKSPCWPVKEPLSTESGPSEILVSAVRSAGSAWAAVSVHRNQLADILEDEKKKKGKASSKVTTCSWGRDALPSEQPKNQSISEIQQEEELLREQDEILEIEAMFAALEVAEIEEALEKSGAKAEPKAPEKKKKAKSKAKESGWSQGWSDWTWRESQTTARWQKRSHAAQRDV